MKRTTSLLSASTFLVTVALSVTATAQETPPGGTTSTPPPPVTTTTPATTSPAATAPTSTPAATTPVGTTTTTAADTGSSVTETPPPATIMEPREADTVTAYRSVRPNRPLLITGGLLLVATYVPTGAIAATEGRAVEDSNLMIPVVGPWLNLADRRCDGCEDETTNVTLIVGSGILQGIGAGMAIMSFFVPEKMAAATIQAGPMKFQVAPTQVGRTGMGLGTVGTF